MIDFYDASAYPKKIITFLLLNLFLFLIISSYSPTEISYNEQENH